MDAPTPPNGGKWKLMSYDQYVSSHLPPLGGFGASDMIAVTPVDMWTWGHAHHQVLAAALTLS